MRPAAPRRRGPDPLPALPPVRRGHREQLDAELLQPAGARRGSTCGRRTEPHDHQPAGRRVGGRRSRPAARRTPRGAVHPDRVDPRRDGLAEPGHDRDRRRSDVPVAGSYTLTNSSVPSPAGRSGQPGQRPTRRPTIANGEQKTPGAGHAGSTSLRATIGNPVTQGRPRPVRLQRQRAPGAGQSADGDSEESVTIANPAAGAWAGASSTASRCRPARRRTTTSTCSPTRRSARWR